MSTLPCGVCFSSLIAGSKTAQKHACVPIDRLPIIEVRRMTRSCGNHGLSSALSFMIPMCASEVMFTPSATSYDYLCLS